MDKLKTLGKRIGLLRAAELLGLRESRQLGFKPSFDRSADLADGADPTAYFSTFRESPNPLYHFAVALGDQIDRPDESALATARDCDAELSGRFLAKGKSQLGFTRHRPQLSAVESRHVMMATILFSTLGNELRHIVEIGGGFGNWARICEGIVAYDRWTIIDLPHVIALQQWFLTQELQRVEAVEFVDTDAYPTWARSGPAPDLVIGAHSLSEFALGDFRSYLRGTVSRAPHLFYATHLLYPSRYLVNKKLAALDKLFERRRLVRTESDQVANIVYQRRA